GDPNPGDTVTYDVYFGTSSSPPKVVNNQSALSYDPGPLSYSTLYYWKIVAWDSHGASAAGPLWHFTTHINNPPNTPSTPNPSNGATGISVNANLSWVGGDPDGDSVTYDVYFGTTSSPPKLVSNQTALLCDPGILTYYTVYYWRIVAWDSHGASSAGPLWNFRTTSMPNRPPYAPSNPSPANGSTEVSVNVDLSWSGGDPDSDDFVTYDVYCGTVLPLIKIATNQTGTSHAIGPSQYSTKYYWKIVAWDNHQASNASPLWSFTSKTDTTLPTIKITSPIKGFLYVNFGDVITRKIPIFITTLVVGKIEVTATATDSQSGISRVEFYVDNELKATDTTASYTWTWLEWGYFFPYILKVKAYDCVGNQNSAEMRVWKIF
ncbi:MAG: Ig-like domain-containing protein, partial [Thermoplasmata archaeon]|nr:Ig-like domain-containing protein [Thermoplasmata archaeon]